MDEEETKRCDNCKREIPLSNHTIHSLHCERNLRLCPVCKEPVPASQLTDHHDTLHKPLPCQQCGDSVCGTDLEDHVRDSCGHTVKSCRYCELELPRRDIPAHESYCGTRTEQCSDCKEWVMLKYRAIHLQSNHGFLRLDDDPIPQPPKPDPLKATNIPKPSSSRAANITNPIQNGGPIASGSNGPRTEIRYFGPNEANSNQGIKNINLPSNTPKNINNPRSNSDQGLNNINLPANTPKNINLPANPPKNINLPSDLPKSMNNPIISNSNHSEVHNDAYMRFVKPKDNKDKGSININPLKNINITNPCNKIKSENRASCSNVPKSCSSNVPIQQNAVNGASNLPKRANDQPQININVANGKKVNKENGCRSSSAGAVKKRPAPPPPARAPLPSLARDPLPDCDPRDSLPPPARDPIREAALCSALDRFYSEQARREQQNQYNRAHGLPPVLTAAAKLDKLRKMDALHNRELEDDGAWKNRLRGRVWMDQYQHSGNVLGSEPSGSRPADLQVDRRRPARSNGRPSHATNDHQRNEFKDLKPMSSSEFEKRFSRMQLDGASGAGNSSANAGTDRFSEIKSSLHALRRGLNEVTAPYVGNPNPPPSPVPADNGNVCPAGVAAGLASPEDSEQVRLPCEFCGLPQPPDDLVQHQTGCRPDLAQRRVPSPPPEPLSPPLQRRPPSPPSPLIPCEFCPSSLPVYLITAHQEQCRHRHRNRNHNRNDNDTDTDSD